MHLRPRESQQPRIRKHIQKRVPAAGERCSSLRVR